MENGLLARDVESVMGRPGDMLYDDDWDRSGTERSWPAKCVTGHTLMHSGVALHLSANVVYLCCVIILSLLPGRRAPLFDHLT